MSKQANPQRRTILPEVPVHTDHLDSIHIQIWIFQRIASSFCWGLNAGATHHSAWERSKWLRGTAVSLVERDFYCFLSLLLSIPVSAQPGASQRFSQEEWLLPSLNCSLVSNALLSVIMTSSAFHLPEIYQICSPLRPRMVRQIHVFPLPS